LLKNDIAVAASCRRGESAGPKQSILIYEIDHTNLTGSCH
jgi:hypothetical protein